MSLNRRRFQIETVRLRLRTLSPVHVGHALRSGTALAQHKGRYVVVDQARLAAVLAREGTFDRYEDLIERALSSRDKDVRWREVARDCGFKLDEVLGETSYAAPGSEGGFIRDGEGEAYVPGTSLKGAIRTALAWDAAREAGGVRKLGPTSQRKDQSGLYLERDTFRRPMEPYAEDRKRKAHETQRLRGTEAINDVLRSFTCGDSTPCADLQRVDTELWKLADPPAWELGRFDRLSANRESLRAGAEVDLTVRLDVALAERFGASGVLGDVASVLSTVDRHSRAVWDEERAYWNGYPSLRRPYTQTYQTWKGVRTVTTRGDTATQGLLRAFYESPPEATCLVRLGWGQGLLGATAIQALPDAPAQSSTRQDVRNRQQNRQQDPAPKSRRIAAWGHGHARAAAPFGWATLAIVTGAP